MDHIFVLYDRRTDSVWYPVDDTSLQAVGGDLKGDALPFLDEPAPQPLAEWVAAHPTTTVLLPTKRDFRRIHRPYFGLSLADEEGSVVVQSVREGGPAELAGVAEGDQLLRVGRETVAERRDLRAILTKYRPGDRVKVLVSRAGQETALRVTFGERPTE